MPERSPAPASEPAPSSSAFSEKFKNAFTAVEESMLTESIAFNDNGMIIAEILISNYLEELSTPAVSPTSVTTKIESIDVYFFCTPGVAHLLQRLNAPDYLDPDPLCEEEYLLLSQLSQDSHKTLSI